MTAKPQRNWMRIETKLIPNHSPLEYRPALPQDSVSLALVMNRAYRGTLDDEGETVDQHALELQGTFTGKYGPFLNQASFVALKNATPVAASLVTHWKGNPLLAYSFTDPLFQGQGLAGLLIERSIDALFQNGYSSLHLMVTRGNTPAEKLYQRLGFRLDPARKDPE